MLEYIRKKYYNFILWYERKMLYFNSFDSKMSIKAISYEYYNPMSDLTLYEFYSGQGGNYVLFEPMKFQFALDKLVSVLYGTEDREVRVEFRCYKYHYSVFLFKKKRKRIKYGDYRKLAYFMRMITFYAYPELRYRKYVKSLCRVACREWKRREQCGFLCSLS